MQPAISASPVEAVEVPRCPGKSPEYYTKLFQHSQAGMLVLDENRQILEVNSALSMLLGLPAALILNRPFIRFIQPEDHPAFERFCRKLSETNEPQTCELLLEKNDRAPTWVHVAASRIPALAGAPEFHFVLSDFTAFMQREKSLERLYVMLAQVNQAIVHYRDSHELYRAVCRIAVKQGKYRMAWVGLVDGPGGQLKPVAHDGHEEGYLQSVHININPGSAFSRFSTVRASGSPSVHSGVTSPS